MAVHLYRTDPSEPASILARVNAVDAERPPVPDWKTLQSRMTYDKIPRTPEAHTAALRRRGRAGNHPTLETIRVMLVEGAAKMAIAAAIGLSANSLSRLLRQHNITSPAKSTRHERVRDLAHQGADAVAAAFGVHRRTAIAFMRAAGVPPSKGGRPVGAKTKVRSVPPPVVLHAEKRPKFTTPAQTVEQFLAAGGQITRCPTVALLPTQATVSAADTAAMRDYYDAKPKGNWRQQRAAEWKRAKQENRAGR